MNKQLFGSLIFALLTTSCIHKSKSSDSSYSKADEPIPYAVPLRNPATTDVDWWSANRNHVQNAKCRNKLPVTTKEIIQYYKKENYIKVDEGVNATISGIQLIDENPRLVLALSKLLIPASPDEKAAMIPENFNKQFNINPKCKDAICASQKIFGDNVGPQMLFLMERFEVNTSTYSFQNADSLTADEIADVIRTFELLQPDQSPFTPNKKLIKFSRGYTRESYGKSGGRVVANSSIELFDAWSQQDSAERQYTLYHEIAHNLSDDQFADYDRSSAWLSLSDWSKLEDGRYERLRTEANAPHPFVSQYGKENPFEDFAESVSSYRLNPQLLKSKSIAKYKIISAFVFGGDEFINAATCVQNAKTNKIQAKLSQFPPSFTDEEIHSIKKNCRNSFYNSVLGHTPNSFFNLCVDYESTLIWYKKNEGANLDIVSHSYFDHKLHISTFQFKKQRLQIANELTPEAADWLITTLNIMSYGNFTSENKAQFCEKWKSISRTSYPEFTISSAWYRNGLFSARSFGPSEQGAVSLCYSLTAGIVPTSKTKTTRILDWVKNSLGVPQNMSLGDFGVTKKLIVQHISERMTQ